ncbi:MAG TPA: ribonuclease III [Candidatus Polarisedimenticolia bacterium]|nr:ribonuclease III [Candidatus Polarisedimenticolia bacterium]
MHDGTRRTPTGSGHGHEWTRLETTLGYHFGDREHLVRALTHSSHAHEEGGGPDNEALEFLGDAALGYFVAHHLLLRFPEMDEGGLSKFKAFLVSRPNLAVAARRIDLGAFLLLGKTAEKGQGRTKESLLADALEAVIASVLLDGGEEAARALVTRLFGEQIQGLSREEVERKDYKTVLQERMQAGGRPTPRYRVVATVGPPHSPTFRVSLMVDGRELARGRGRSKKEAEQRAARMALRVINARR